MSVKYKLRDGEHVRSVAKHFGFETTDAIAEHPDNAGIVAKRGHIDKLVPGDVFTLPEGKKGKKKLGAGRGHTLVVSKMPGTFSLALESAFRIADPDKPGDLAASPVRWNAFNTTLKVAGATVEVRQNGGGLVFQNTTNGKGQAEFPHLDDGKWIVDVKPLPDELSAGLAQGDATADHGLGFYISKGSKSGKPKKGYPRNGTYELEYRAIQLLVKVSKGTIDSVAVLLPAAGGARPLPVIPFWKSVGASAARQVLHVEWKPDFLRRIKTKLRPTQRNRDARFPDIDLIVVHHTAGFHMGSQISTFTGPSTSSGAHFLNDVDGHVVRMADDKYWTQHAGGYNDQRAPNWSLQAKELAGNRKLGYEVNEWAIGIENVHGDDTDSAHLEAKHNPYTEAQYASLTHLVRSLMRTYDVSVRHVVGHSDVTPKARCPGPHMEWEKLEAGGAALAPAVLAAGEEDVLFGTYFSGPDGVTRRLELDDADKRRPDGKFQLVRGKKVIADGLPSGPIAALESALATIGYGVDERVKSKDEPVHRGGLFDKVLAFCIGQFMRHYCTGSRVRLDQKAAYLEVDQRTGRAKVFVDLELAKLIRRVELAAAAE